jgi:hypothetical protein
LPFRGLRSGLLQPQLQDREKTGIPMTVIYV